MGDNTEKDAMLGSEPSTLEQIKEWVCSLKAVLDKYSLYSVLSQEQVDRLLNHLNHLIQILVSNRKFVENDEDWRTILDIFDEWKSISEYMSCWNPKIYELLDQADESLHALRDNVMYQRQKRKRDLLLSPILDEGDLLITQLEDSKLEDTKEEIPADQPNQEAVEDEAMSRFRVDKKDESKIDEQ